MTADDKHDARALREQQVTEEVVASFNTASDQRFRQVMTSLVEHLHDFARDVRLTQQEWDTAIAFLTETGQISSETRQEFILLSDVLGLSMLTVGINAPARPQVTESTVFGPFFVHGSPHIELGGNLAEGVSGKPCHVHGRVRGVTGEPIPNARVEIWEADDDGFYDVQYDGALMQGRAHLFTAEDGAYDFWSVQPAAYPIPHDGPVGRLLARAGRSPMRPAHIHYMVSAPGYQTLITHIFVAGDEHLDSDAVFGVKPSLVVEFIEREPHDHRDPTPPGVQLDQPWAEVAFDVVLDEAASPPKEQPTVIS